MISQDGSAEPGSSIFILPSNRSASICRGLWGDQLCCLESLKDKLEEQRSPASLPGNSTHCWQPIERACCSSALQKPSQVFATNLQGLSAAINTVLLTPSILQLQQIGASIEDACKQAMGALKNISATECGLANCKQFYIDPQGKHVADKHLVGIKKKIDDINLLLLLRSNEDEKMVMTLEK